MSDTLPLGKGFVCRDFRGPISGNIEGTVVGGINLRKRDKVIRYCDYDDEQTQQSGELVAKKRRKLEVLNQDEAIEEENEDNTIMAMCDEIVQPSQQPLLPILTGVPLLPDPVLRNVATFEFFGSNILGRKMVICEKGELSNFSCISSKCSKDSSKKSKITIVDVRKLTVYVTFQCGDVIRVCPYCLNAYSKNSSASYSKHVNNHNEEFMALYFVNSQDVLEKMMNFFIFKYFDFCKEQGIGFLSFIVGFSSVFRDSSVLNFPTVPVLIYSINDSQSIGKNDNKNLIVNRI